MLQAIVDKHFKSQEDSRMRTFRFLFFVTLCVACVLLIFGCNKSSGGGSKGGNSITEPGGDGPGLQGELSGDTNQIVLTIQTGDQPVYVTVGFVTSGSYCESYPLVSASETLSLGDGWWRITFDVPPDALIEWRWQIIFFGDPNGQANYALEPEDNSIVITSPAFTIYNERHGDDFAFAEFVTDPPDFSRCFTYLDGDTQKLTFRVYTGEMNPQFTEVRFFGPDGTLLPVYSLAATSSTMIQLYQWEIVFDIPSEAQVDQRWKFGFVNPQTGSWFWSGSVQIQTANVVMVDGNLAFADYVP